MTLVAFGVLVALALLSLGTLISIFIAGVIALGLDPVVGYLVKRGWKRGPSALVVFAALFVFVFLLVILAVGPVWDQIQEFVHDLPEYWDKLQQQDWFQSLVNSAGADDSVRKALQNLAKGLPEAASTLLGVAGGVFGS